MALLNGKLFAGALFAGALFGAQPDESLAAGGGSPARQFFPSYPEKPILQEIVTPPIESLALATFLQSPVLTSLAEQIALNAPSIPLSVKQGVMQPQELSAMQDASAEAIQPNEKQKALLIEDEFAIALLMMH